MNNRVRLIFLILLSISSLIAVGAKGSNDGKQDSVKRVGGIYRVSSINKMSEGSYRIEFSSVTKTGRYDVLFLESDHVHVGLDEGAELRLSAEVIEDKGSYAEVGQVLLFFPSGDTYIPVWLLSKKISNFELRGSKYLEMHAPTSDYLIF
ncbi:MAG: hypothetical protein HQK54_02620 [Oligoflexales bacterium]|nr:hypothetical protein [Oligoflexales bacterium]